MKKSKRASELLFNRHSVAQSVSSFRHLQNTLSSSSELASIVSSQRSVGAAFITSNSLLEAVSSAKHLQNRLVSNGSHFDVMNSVKQMKNLFDSSSALAQALSSARRMRHEPSYGSSLGLGQIAYIMAFQSKPSRALTESLQTLFHSSNFSFAIEIVEQKLANHDLKAGYKESEISVEKVESSINSLSEESNSEAFMRRFTIIDG